MGIEDIPKVAKAAKAARAAEKAAQAAEATRVVKIHGKRYRVLASLTDEEAARLVWNNVLKPKAAGGEKEITLPSELPEERIKALEKEVNPPKADVIPLKPVREQVKEDLGLRPDIWDP